MSRIHVEASAVINAKPEIVYAILRDYEREHPNILPKQYFTAVVVEQGGQGAGTVFRVSTKVLGSERKFHMTVSEPEPGRQLMETDDSGLSTSFTLKPINNGQQTELTIATEWEAAGFAGWLEGWLTPPLMRQIYIAELSQIETYVQSKRSA